MKKSCLLIAILILSLMLTGCCTTKAKEPEVDKPERLFVMVERTYSWYVVYDKETKVMYAVSNLSSGAGKFTLLVNADGTPKLWEGENE